MYIKNINPTPKFWLHVTQQIKLFINNNDDNFSSSNAECIIIVPTANHIPLLENSLSQAKFNVLPSIQTLNHILNEYNFSYKNYNQYQEYLKLYQFFKHNNELWNLTTAKSVSQKWQFIQTMVDTCHELSKKYLNSYSLAVNVDENIDELIMSCIEKEYISLSQKIANAEAQILLNIWKHTISQENQPFYTWNACREFAQYIIQNTNKKIIYIQFDDEDENISHIHDEFKQSNLDRILIIKVSLDFSENNYIEHILDLFPEANYNSSYQNISINHHKQDVTENAFNTNNLKIVKCNNLEQSANYVLNQIIQAFQQGKKELALIAQDRVAIRRIKSLLQVHGIPMADETGWKMSTTILATSIHKWLNILQSKKIDLIWIKKSNLFADELIISLEKIDIHNQDLDYACKFILNKFNSHSTQEFYANIQLWQKNHSLEEWLNIFYNWCKWLNLDVFEHNLDTLLSYINDFCNADLQTNYSSEEWISFLQNILEQAHIASLYDIAEQKVHIIALNGSRLRTFDAVWFIGADDNQFPSSQEHNLFLNENIRYELGLETKLLRFSKQSIDLIQLISMHYDDTQNNNNVNNNIEFIYQAYGNDNCEQSLSRWLEKLKCFANVECIEYDDFIDISLEQSENINHDLNSIINNTDNNILKSNFNDNAVLRQNAMSIGAYDIMNMYTCPYKFYLSKIAKLNKPYVSDESDASDYGTWIHEILYYSHKKYHNQLDNQYDFKHFLEMQTNITFSGGDFNNNAVLSQNVMSVDAKAREMQQLWYTQLPKYNLWQQQNSHSGYLWHGGEIKLTHQISLSDSSSIKLSTKLDRIDINHQLKEIKIIDYKWKSSKGISKNDEINNIQLLIYAYMYKHNPDIKFNDYAISASFLSLKDEVKEIMPFNDSDELIKTSENFIQDFSSKMEGYIIHNQPFIATPNKNCRFCDYRHMCVYKNNNTLELDIDID